MTIKAIETHYAGCRFRSRLEARWAVFFDTLGIRWEYEPEGLQFDDGTHYLPDFRLPKLRIWFEVKASLTPIDVKWRRLHDELHVPGFVWHDSVTTARRAFERIVDSSRQAAREIDCPKICDSKHDPCFCGTCQEPATRRAEVLQREAAQRSLPDRTFLAGSIPRIPDAADRLEFSCMIGPGSPHAGWTWCLCAVCGDVDVCHVAWPVPLMCGHEADEPFVDAEKLRAAYRAARSARFEHGESG